jgi:L-lactate dehydrogenase complex protein LldE
MRVGLFIPCYVDQFYPAVAIATLRLLEQVGCEVVVPDRQTCCGQPMANAGFAHLTEGCDRNFAAQFGTFDHVVSPSGSCVLHVQQHNPLIPGKVWELCQFLTDVVQIDSLPPQPNPQPKPVRVGLHQSCHGQRGLRLASMSERNEPHFSKLESVLSLVSGLELHVPERPDECCGFGGTFCVTEEAISVKMGADRVAAHRANQVDYIVGSDVSCLMHLEGILRRQQSAIQVRHVAQFLTYDW